MIARNAGLLLTAFLLFAVLLVGCALNPDTLPVSEILLPQDAGPITLQELTYDERLDRLIVPGGRAGVLFLVHPQTRAIETLKLFEPGEDAQGQPGGGVVSAARGPGLGRDLLFVLDQNGPALHAVDPKSKVIVASAPTQGLPEVVRYIPTSNELWVTEPELEQIEVFRLTDGNSPSLASVSTISVPAGPKGLVFDPAFSLVYTNQPTKGLTTTIVVSSHALGTNWGNGCTQVEGMALDAQKSYLFVACREGKLVIVDVNPGNPGRQIDSKTFGGDLRTVDYNSQTERIYLPSGRSAIVGVFSVIQATPTPPPTAEESIFAFLSASQATPTAATASHEHQELTVLNLLGSADTGFNANCIASDPRGNVWVCDPDRGSIYWVNDVTIQE